MKLLKNKLAALVLSVLMITVIGGTITMTHGQTAGSILVPTIAFCNVAPNPCGVGQTVTVNFWLAVPLFAEQDPVNMTVYVTPPGGTQTSARNIRRRHNWRHIYYLHTDGNRQLHVPTEIRRTAIRSSKSAILQRTQRKSTSNPCGDPNTERRVTRHTTPNKLLGSTS